MRRKEARVKGQRPGLLSQSGQWTFILGNRIKMRFLEGKASAATNGISGAEEWRFGRLAAVRGNHGLYVYI